ncbi:MAG: phosphatase PAP2 family protein [Promethearchaeia archaeon]
MGYLVISKIERWDHQIFLNFYQSEFSKKSKQFAKIVSFFGNIYFWGILWLILGVYGYITKDYYLFILMTGGFEQSFAIYILVRYGIIKRRRPFEILEEHGVRNHDDMIDKTRSFPSGHVTFFLFFGILFAFAFNSWILFMIVIIFDILIAITRLILGVHFPSDVIFGFLFGMGFAILYLGFTYRYWFEFYYWLGDVFAFLDPMDWF